MQQQGDPYAATTGVAAALELEVTAGPSAGLRLTVHEDFRVGSAESGPAALGGDRWLSPAHALFHVGPDGWAIEDLRSAEGTTVNGRTVRGAVTIKPGDTVELGSSRIAVLGADGAGGAAAPPGGDGFGALRREENRRPLDSRRLLALLIDSLALSPLAYLAAVPGHGRAPLWIAVASVTLTYFFLCESLWGQTIGKRVMKLRVVRADGAPLTPSKVAGRTVLRIVDQQIACLVGMLTMILTGRRRQRLGDLAARTAVTRADAPAPAPRVGGRERLALWIYPLLWVAPAVLFWVLVPESRLLSCEDVGISMSGGREGSCLVPGPDGSKFAADIVNAGHALRLPGYDARLVATRTRAATRPALRAAGAPPGVDAMVVSFKLSIRNTSGGRLPFELKDRSVRLIAFGSAGGVTEVSQLPRRVRTGLRPFAAARGPIARGRTRTAWARFVLPRESVQQLRVGGPALVLAPVGEQGAVAHQGVIRLGRAATPAGIRALSGLSG